MTVEPVDYLVSREFRKILLDRFPALATNSAYRYLLGHILYGTWADSESGELVIHSKLLAAMNDEVKGWEGGNFEALKFIESFSRDVFYIEYRAQDIYQGRRARRIVWTDAPADLVRMSLDQSVLGSCAVWFGSGKPVSGNDGTRIRAALETEAITMAQNAKSPEASAILSYLNGLPSHRFTKLLHANLDSAVQRLTSIKGSKDREREWKLIKSIAQQPKPHYKPVPNSVRLYSLNPSFVLLRKDVRLALTAGWYSADLQSAQLAIIAKIWDCPQTTDFLGQGQSIWSSLSRHFNVQHSNDLKPVFKELLYRIAFGAGKKGLQAYAAANLGGAQSFDHFLSHEIVSEVWAAREKTKKQLEEVNQIVDAFGNILRLDKHAKLIWTPETSKYRSTSNALSLMAQQAQSYEMKLIWPVFEKAISIAKNDRHGFMITSYLLDGLTFVPFDSKDAEKWISWLQCSVSKQATDLGIPTRLEVEKVV